MESSVHKHEHSAGTKEIWRTFWILLVLTLVELVLGYWMISMPEESGSRLAVKGAIIILMLAKAFYIVAYFMHLKHELKSFIMTIIVPLFLFVWFIIAFLADGNSFKNLRSNYDKGKLERSQTQAPKSEHGHEGSQHEEHQETPAGHHETQE
jgi:cytochrome c oxidase subunit 4